jgi:signal transduction histidine kinase
MQTFHTWAHSSTTVVILAVAWLVLAVMVFTPLGRRVSGRSPSGTLRAVVVVLGVLGAASWATHIWWFTILMMVALWSLVVWYVVTLIGPAMSGAGRLKAELDPEERAQLQAEQAAAAERGASLERVLDEIDEERHE